MDYWIFSNNSNASSMDYWTLDKVWIIGYSQLPFDFV
jgi:hypothetical protein